MYADVVRAVAGLLHHIRAIDCNSEFDKAYEYATRRIYRLVTGNSRQHSGEVRP